MTEIPNSKLLNAIIILLIVLILVIVSSILSEKYEKYNNKNQKHTLEPFANYQDVKKKTINWCKNMQNVGLLTPDQYDQCVATFKDVTVNRLPATFPVPDTGIGRNFSLYNTASADKSGQLSNSFTGGNSNNFMLVTRTGLYIGCSPDNTLYTVKNINDSTLNQRELYFTLVPQTNTVYAIMSPYRRYLMANVNPSNNKSIPTIDNSVKPNLNIPVTTLASVPSNTCHFSSINTEWTASFTGTKIGPMSTWTLSKINNSVTFESIQYSGFFMSFNDNNKSLEIIYGSDDTAMWTMIPEAQTVTDGKFGTYTGAEFFARGVKVLEDLKKVYIQKMCLNEMKNGLTKFQNMIKNNYAKIATEMRNILDPLHTSEELYNDDIIKVLAKITSTSSNYINKINTDISNNIDTELKDLHEKSVVSEYDQYLIDLNNELNSVNVRITNNNKIVSRQQDNYDKINNDYADINQKTIKAKESDETAKLNIDLVNNYTLQNSYLLYIYPILILILGLVLIYLSYLTIMKFKVNIYDKY